MAAGNMLGPRGTGLLPVAISYLIRANSRTKQPTTLIMYKFIYSLFFVAASPVYAAVLTMLPTPMEQGGMIHINVAYNEITEVLTAVPASGTPVLQPLTSWKPSDQFDPASPWYTTLDPSQSGYLFNSQFGLVLSGSDPFPIGSRMFVTMVSATPGLEVYRTRNTATQLFDGIMGTNASSASWDWSTVAHGMFHPMFVLPSGFSGPATATLEFVLVDGVGDPLPGVAPVQAVIGVTAVPEPATMSLFAVAAVLGLVRRRQF
jgi:hypothetical protein